MGGNMRLRNKKTGEVREDSDLGKMLIRYAMPSYDSIAELCEEWEDYKPAEPLIKDEKIRRAVRAWAEAEDVTICRVDKSGSCLMNLPSIIQFLGRPFAGLNNREYTIAELCGEEEE